ncbi:MAG TPA: hypothetical protein VNS63_17895, partial [Blastocatellia bacterium]|nr:hypothetical protein [Blastocatellia bacterium]
MRLKLFSSQAGFVDPGRDVSIREDSNQKEKTMKRAITLLSSVAVVLTLVPAAWGGQSKDG